MGVLTLDRCLCIHSMSQIVDIVVQSLAFQRRITSAPIPQLLRDEPGNKNAQKYQEICDSLRALFKECNINILKEIVIIVGPTPYMAEEIYNLPVRLCEEHTGTMDTGCGDTCRDLSRKEARNVFMEVQNILSSITTDIRCNAKLFVYARVTEPPLNTDMCENLEEDDAFELPDLELMHRRKVVKREIRVKKCRQPIILKEDVMLEQKSEEMHTENTFWMRVVPFLVYQA